ncbi:hypothetical protein AB5J52_09050 [Streptomyces sp. R39]|uniref:Uncharacterized protein n=1 Tax=Streptomyces sp. R39 TaxID=3238631 RepID=A0AB39QLK6_9ACTN
MDFPPVPNGIDYLSEVVTRLARPDAEVSPRDLKYAVLHLQAATEVPVKARLHMEHWTRQAVRKNAITAAPGRSTPDSAAYLRLIHTHCHRWRGASTGSRTALQPASGPSGPA